MLKKIKSFIKVSIIITSVVFAAISVTSQVITAKVLHTYIKISDLNGTIWVYEYDEDGNLVNIYPDIS